MDTYIELPVTVEFDATPYRPAYISGLPENCYPAEGREMEITSVKCGDVELIDVLTDKQISDMEQACWDYLNEQRCQP